MVPRWFPRNRIELNRMLESFLSDRGNKKVNGVVVPHAGYNYSGSIAGDCFSFISRETRKAVVIGPSHNEKFSGIRVMEDTKTPFGKPKIMENNFSKMEYEHSVKNQIPFLQKINPNMKILPLVVGDITSKEAKKIADKISEPGTVYVFSTDLSHFLSYEEAVKKDKKTMEIIKKLDLDNFEDIDACGKAALLIMMHLCKKKGWKPKLVKYKNSGDITQTKIRVVGYAGFRF